MSVTQEEWNRIARHIVNVPVCVTKKRACGCAYRDIRIGLRLAVSNMKYRKGLELRASVEFEAL